MKPSKPSSYNVSRRQVALTGLAGLGAAVGVRVHGGAQPHAADRESEPSMNTSRMPVVFVPHGGGPFSYVDLGLPASEVDTLVAYWQSVGTLPKEKPRALLVVSAHWEESAPTVMAAVEPPMLFDYYGFPAAAYTLKWPAPGSPQLASRVAELLSTAGIPANVDTQRGFDHGVYIPLGRSFPLADVPTIQLSLKRGLDPAEHLAIGRALAPLRDEGVFIIGSGMSYHNMRGFGSRQADAEAAQFDSWFRDTVTAPSSARDARLIQWTSAPAARHVHPREEHLLPLMVIAGAAGADEGSVPFSGKVFGKQVSAAQFG